jgi:hypothetical protein
MPDGHRDETARELREMRPLREGFKVIDRFGFDLDDTLNGVPARSKRARGREDTAGGMPTGVLLTPGLMPIELSFNLACNRRISRSCSSCSRTGLTRSGSPEGLQTVEFTGLLNP